MATISTCESLLKYDKVVLVNKSRDRKSKGRPLRANPHQPLDSRPVHPPPKRKSCPTDAPKQEKQEVLNRILPPREWMEGNQHWVQQVSSAPCTRDDILHLEDVLNKRLQQRQARETGICPDRRELYSQCFDELIRQEIINCAERGLFLSRVRDEIKMTMDAYQTLYESSVAFGIRKALQGEQRGDDMEKKISDLESDNQDLRRQLEEQKAKYDAIEKREHERRQTEEKKHMEKVQSLKRDNQQLKTQLEQAFVPKK